MTTVSEGIPYEVLGSLLQTSTRLLFRVGHHVITNRPIERRRKKWPGKLFTMAGIPF